MPLTFPTLSFGSVCLTPLVRTVQSKTRVLRMADDTEKRWRTGPPLDGFTLAYSHLTWADVQTLGAFFDQTKGGYDHSWTFTVPSPLSQSFTSMAFEDDMFTYSRQVSGRYQVSLRIRQTAQSESIGALGAFPATVQCPYVAASVYETVRNDLESGAAITYANRTTPRKRFVLNEPFINETELAAFLTHFIAAGGRWKSFTATDANDSSTYTVRYDQDQIEARYLGPRQCSTAIQLLEVPA